MDLPGMKLAPRGAPKEALDAIPGLPADLRAFLEQHDGGRGKVGKQPVVLWGAEQIAAEAQSQEVSLSAPGLLLFLRYHVMVAGSTTPTVATPSPFQSPDTGSQPGPP